MAWKYQEVPSKRWVYEFGVNVRVELYIRAVPHRDDEDGWVAELFVGHADTKSLVRTCILGPGADRAADVAQVDALAWAASMFRQFAATLDHLAGQADVKRRRRARAKELADLSARVLFAVPEHVQEVCISDLTPMDAGHVVMDVAAVSTEDAWRVTVPSRAAAVAQLHELGWFFSPAKKSWVRTTAAQVTG